MFPIVSAKALLLAMERIGLSRSKLQRRAGISDVALESRAELPDERFAALWHEAFSATGRPSLTLEVAQQLPIGSFAPVDLSAVLASHVGEACVAVARAAHVFVGGASLTIETKARGSVSLSVLHSERLETDALSDELILAVLIARLREHVASPIQLEHVHLIRHRPVDASPWGRFFQAPVTFDAKVSSIRWPAQSWRTPLRAGNPTLHRALAEFIPAKGNSLCDDARAHLRSALPRILTIGELGSALGLSTRTLQRRLAAERVSFRKLIDDVRRQESMRFIRHQRLELSDLAFRLGFSDHASFSRAFTRWTGESPSLWRYLHLR